MVDNYTAILIPIFETAKYFLHFFCTLIKKPYFALKLQLMAVLKRGRKPLKKGENLVPVRIFVKAKFLTRAQAACAAIANKYR